MKVKYGLTGADVDAMVAAQGGCCAICKSKTHGHKNWHVDHDHVTGCVRGVLCGHCNPGLGNFKDSPAALVSAAVYLGDRGYQFIQTPIADWLKANPL